ncbi:MAG: HEAT repeat domain-containing protein, partial [Spirochaetales bacterium]|nr:HEAT repeat domain-containing protein [Spirochaetales bacterium]
LSLSSKNIPKIQLIRSAKLFTSIEKKQLFESFELEEFASQKLTKHRSAKLARLLLENSEGLGLHTVFKIALDNQKIATVFKEFLTKNDPFSALQMTAKAVPGFKFDGKKALSVIGDQITTIRELTGDNDWSVRYFAVQILLCCDEDLARRAVIEMAEDSNSFVRLTIANEFNFDDEKSTYEFLKKLLTDDMVFEVRKAAIKRIQKDFKLLHEIDFEKLELIKKRHVVELFDKESEQDCSTALKILEGNDDSLAYYAAGFLKKNGKLQELIDNIPNDDEAGFQRDYKILEKACEVGINSFLEKAVKSQNQGTLLATALLLEKFADPGLIVECKRQIFSVVGLKSGNKILKTLLKTACARPNVRLLEELRKDLKEHRDNELFVKTLLPMIDKGNYYFFREVLEELLIDIDFQFVAELQDAIVRAGNMTELPLILKIIKSDRDKYSHLIKIRALQILGKFSNKCYLQDIMQHLYILPLEEAKEFALELAKFGGSDFDAIAENIISSADARLKASLIAALPSTEKKKFIPSIEAALSDSSPEVRAAAAWALVDYKAAKSYKLIYDLLRDPVDEVRAKTAGALAYVADQQAVTELESILKKDNEIDCVKSSVIEALAVSSNLKSVEILVDLLDKEHPMFDEIRYALANKTKLEEIKLLIEFFKDADLQKRNIIQEVFVLMGIPCEEALKNLLLEEILSLKEHIVEIMSSTGAIENTIRKLSNKDMLVRRDAAKILSTAGSLSAFRGLILAAQDPDVEVRKLVIKALEKLGDEKGEQLLAQLKNDPDKKIRRYTDWALERIEAEKIS